MKGRLIEKIKGSCDGTCTYVIGSILIASNSNRQSFFSRNYGNAFFRMGGGGG